MTRLQSFIVALTLVVCLGVGLLASQRSTPKSPVASDDEPLPPLELPDVVPAVATEPVVSPRKLTADDAAPATDHPVRRAIDRLMPNASAEERQIWFEELRGLPVNAVEDLLRLRKESNATAPLRTAPEPIATDLSDSIPNSLLRYRVVLRHNLLNADTPGYRALRTEWLPRPLDITHIPENRVPDALHNAGVRIDTRVGEFVETGRSLDLGIQGDGWFVVEDEKGELAFTRHGALRMNEKRELELPAIPNGRPLSPRITIPETTAHVFIETNGKILGGAEWGQWDTDRPLGQIRVARFFDDSALVLHEDGLYRPTKSAGMMSLCTPSKQAGFIQCGVLERSNVQRETQELALERVEQRLQRDTPKTP
jgi:flagellar basal body rod protein FlgG